MTTEKPEALRLARELEGVYPVNIQDQEAAAAELRRLHAKVAELEAQLEAVGAGGVGPLMARGHAEQPAAATLRASERAVERDELLQVALNFIETLTGMQPPPIEIAPPEVFAPFRDFVDRVQAIADHRSAQFPKQQPAKQEASDRVMAAARDLLTWIEWEHRPPVRDTIEAGRMVRVRLHALADLHDAVKALEEA